MQLDFRDDGGEQYIRIQIQNTSSQQIEGLKAQVDSLTPDTQAISLRNDGDPYFLDLPIQLFTQERLKERMAGSPDFVRPFNLAAGEKRRLELFQVILRLGNLHVFDTSKRHDLSASDSLRFAGTIHGGGNPAIFVVNYKPEGDGYRVTLTDANEIQIDEKGFP